MDTGRQSPSSWNASEDPIEEAFGSLLADDVVWHTIGGETMHGADAVASSMSGMEGVEFEGNLHDVVGNDDHVVGLIEAHVKTGDQEFSYRTAEIMHVVDGKVTERRAFSDDTQAIIDFFSGLGACRLCPSLRPQASWANEPDRSFYAIPVAASIWSVCAPGARTSE